MIRAVVVIVNSRGLHARPASRLAKLARQFNSEIKITKGRRVADAASIASLLMLVAPQNTELTITAKGKDEGQAVNAILELIAGGFDDGVNTPAIAENPPAIDTPTAMVMKKIDGIGTAKGAALGKVYLRMNESEVPRYQLPKTRIDAEQKRFEQAIKKVRQELSVIYKTVTKMEEATLMLPFIDVYRGMLDDAAIVEKIHAIIQDKQCNAEWAIQQHSDIICAKFLNITDLHFRARADDIKHVMRRLLTAIRKPGKSYQKALPINPRDYIVAAAELDPAHVIVLRQQGYAGVVTESGGNTSHTAILARSMGIPAIIGAKGVLAAVKNDDNIILDMDNNAVIIHPDEATLSRYKSYCPSPAREENIPPIKKRRKIVTRDKQTIHIEANIELPEETAGVLNSQAGGIGLFRTEFLFLNRDDLPSEDEQFEVYRKVLRDVFPLPVVMRTVDLGLDKVGGDKLTDSNPLGMRAIRYCLSNTRLFMNQLRALLRAATEYKNIKILLPMLAHPIELEQTVVLINHAREQLRATRGIHAPIPPLGAMIEVPAAVFVMRAFARHLNFFSIGTNDLTQYMLAADRSHEGLARYYQEPHPAIICFLSQIVANAANSRKSLTLCGELAGNADMTRMLLALGLRRLSMSIPQIGLIHEVVADTDCRQLEKWRDKILRAATPKELQADLKKLNTATH